MRSPTPAGASLGKDDKRWQQAGPSLPRENVVRCRGMCVPACPTRLPDAFRRPDATTPQSYVQHPTPNPRSTDRPTGRLTFSYRATHFTETDSRKPRCRHDDDDDGDGDRDRSGPPRKLLHDVVRLDPNLNCDGSSAADTLPLVPGRKRERERDRTQLHGVNNSPRAPLQHVPSALGLGWGNSNFDAILAGLMAFCREWRPG